MYKVSQLTKILEVPRSTINDWVSRYDRLIDYTTLGKRKVYSERTLEVLKEVAELRNQGLSSFEIEVELEKRHPLNGEIHEAPEEKTQNSKPDIPENNMPAVVDKEAFALIAKEQATEMAESINEQLGLIAQKLHAIEKTEAVTIKKSSAAPWFLLTMLIFAAAGAVIYYGYNELEKQKHANLNLQQQQSELAITNKQLAGQLQNAKNDFNRTTSELASERKNNQEQLEKQRRSFDELLAELKKSAAQDHNTQLQLKAELLEAESKIAAMQKNYLEKVSKLANSNKNQNQTLIEYQKLFDEQKKNILKLTEKLENFSSKLINQSKKENNSESAENNDSKE